MAIICEKHKRGHQLFEWIIPDDPAQVIDVYDLRREHEEEYHR